MSDSAKELDTASCRSSHLNEHNHTDSIRLHCRTMSKHLLSNDRHTCAEASLMLAIQNVLEASSSLTNTLQCGIRCLMCWHWKQSASINLVDLEIQNSIRLGYPCISMCVWDILRLRIMSLLARLLYDHPSPYLDNSPQSVPWQEDIKDDGINGHDGCCVTRIVACEWCQGDLAKLDLDDATICRSLGVISCFRRLQGF